MSRNRENLQNASHILRTTIVNTKVVTQADQAAWLGTGLTLIADALLEVAGAIESSTKAKS